MAFDLPDFWTTVGIGLALLSLVPGMTSVPSASHIEFKVSRFCVLAAATLFLFKLALWGSESLTITRLALVAVFGALIAVSAAYALHWINRKEEATIPALTPVAQDSKEIAPKITDDKKQTAIAAPIPVETHEQQAPARRGPTLEATNGSRIDATGAIIPGDLPFQFGKADGGSVIDMPGTVVTRREDGSITIEPGKIPVNRTFPPPTGEFSNLSNDEMRERALATAISVARGGNVGRRIAPQDVQIKIPKGK
jgi:hypothetical protein